MHPQIRLPQMLVMCRNMVRASVVPSGLMMIYRLQELQSEGLKSAYLLNERLCTSHWDHIDLSCGVCVCRAAEVESQMVNKTVTMCCEGWGGPHCSEGGDPFSYASAFLFVWRTECVAYYFYSMMFRSRSSWTVLLYMELWGVPWNS